jgi:peptidoglycan LD-endopeptidase LytH
VSRKGTAKKPGILSRLLGTAFVLALVAAAAAVAWFAVERQSYDGPQTAVFPLPARYAGSYTNDWGASRTQGRHEGTDVFAPEGTPIRSITGGTVTHAYGSDGDGWNTLGGYTVMVEAAYDVGEIKRGDRLYYAHMNAPTPLEPGDVVVPGQKIGEVGDTGQGPKGTSGEFEPHLHLGWYAGWGALSPDDRPTAASGAMNPYPLLRWIERQET